MFLNKRHFRADGFSIFQSAALGHRLFLTACLLLATIVLVFLFAPSIILGHTFAEPEPGPEEAIPISPFISLSVAGNTNNIALDIAPLGPNGNFRSSSTVDNIRVSTSNYTGYTLGITAKVDNDNALSYTPSGSSTTYEIPSIATSVSAADYADDIYASTNGLNNTWGYRPSTLYDVASDDNVANTDFLPGPTSTVDQTIIAKTKGPNASDNTDGYNISIGARVDSTTPPGSYTNTFVITAVANSIPYVITYNANDGHDGQDTSNMPVSPEQEIVDATTPTITLPNNAPTRSGYIFKGWCTVQTTDNQATCPGTEYRPGTSLSVDYTTDHITLYARWVDATLWNAVVDEWELGGSRIQTNDTNENTGIKAPITTTNSGVFQYNSEAFGNDTDAEKEGGGKDNIYYFRGILDSDLDGTKNTYGSNGNGELWPNYVRLNDTCWRIVRTTASGGVKMIYNGLYSGGTNANSCANATISAQIGTSAFNATNNISADSIIAAGYTFNNNYATTETDTPYGELFGTNEDYSGNTTDSTIKEHIEEWFTNESGISAYESMLEPNAGYCNDRSVYRYENDQYILLDNNNYITTPYAATSGVVSYYFGAFLGGHTQTEVRPSSLNCLRNVADVYTVKTTDNGSNINTHGGNGQLTHPVALLTADEMVFAGSGRQWDKNYHFNSYLRSGSFFWSLSPDHRAKDGGVIGILFTINGFFSVAIDVSLGTSESTINNPGVRPATSLISGTRYASGTGTAVDPWVVVAPAQE